MAGPEPTGRRRLSRSRQERLLFGVCGGLAAYFDVDPALVRIGFVLAGIFPPLTGFSVIGYILLAVILPEEDSLDLPGRDQLRHNLDGLRADVSQMAEGLGSKLGMGSRSSRSTVDVDLPEVSDVTVPAPSSQTPQPPPASPASPTGSAGSTSSTGSTAGGDRSETAEPPRPTGAVR